MKAVQYLGTVDIRIIPNLCTETVNHQMFSTLLVQDMKDKIYMEPLRKSYYISIVTFMRIIKSVSEVKQFLTMLHKK